MMYSAQNEPGMLHDTHTATHTLKLSINIHHTKTVVQ